MRPDEEESDRQKEIALGAVKGFAAGAVLIFVLEWMGGFHSAPNDIFWGAVVCAAIGGMYVAR